MGWVSPEHAQALGSAQPPLLHPDQPLQEAAGKGESLIQNAGQATGKFMKSNCANAKIVHTDKSACVLN